MDEIKNRTYTFEDIQDIYIHLKKDFRRKKYITIFFSTLWASLLILYMLITTENIFAFLVGAITTTFVVYLLDQTGDTISNYFKRGK